MDGLHCLWEAAWFLEESTPSPQMIQPRPAVLNDRSTNIRGLPSVNLLQPVNTMALYENRSAFCFCAQCINLWDALWVEQEGGHCFIHSYTRPVGGGPRELLMRTALSTER